MQENTNIIHLLYLSSQEEQDCYDDNVTSETTETEASESYQPSSSSSISKFAHKKQSPLYHFIVGEVVDSYELPDDANKLRLYK